MGCRWLLLLAMVGFGCGGANPSAYRSLNTLISGRWFNTDPQVAESPNTIDFNPDGTFEASSGVPGVNVRNLKGRYWQEESFLGLRGWGEQGGVHVQFVKADLVETPELRLTVTEIGDDYVAQMMGVTRLEALLASQIQEALQKLKKAQIPPDVLGYSEVCEKRD